MKRFKILLNGQPKDYWANNLADLCSRFRKSYPQYKHLKLSDLQPVEVEWKR